MRLDPVRICRLVALFAIVAVLVNFYTGYLRRPTPTDSAVSESRVFRVSSSELFTGEMKRFEPHLGLTSSGCVRSGTARSSSRGSRRCTTRRWWQGCRKCPLIALRSSSSPK